MDNEPIIQIRDLVFSYGGMPIFNGDQACIHRGDYVAVVGPNGGGKSTLIKLIIGLLKPNKGSILINGHPPAAMGSRLGYVPQHVNYDDLFPITVRESVLSGTLTRGLGFYSREDKSRADEMIDLVGLQEERYSSFAQISGGQRQRALIARALASRPEILILDEPTSSVDAEVEKQFHDLLAKLSRDLTIILITHNFSFVDEEVNRVFCINRRIHEHPAQSVNEELITASYGRPVKTVLHREHLQHSHGKDAAHG